MDTLKRTRGHFDMLLDTDSWGVSSKGLGKFFTCKKFPLFHVKHFDFAHRGILEGKEIN